MLYLYRLPQHNLLLEVEKETQDKGSKDTESYNLPALPALPYPYPPFRTPPAERNAGGVVVLRRSNPGRQGANWQRRIIINIDGLVGCPVGSHE